MTPAAVLVCMTIVTNLDHATVASRACHYEQPPVAMVSENLLTTIAENTVKTQETDVKALSIADTAVKLKAKKPKYKKQAARKMRIRHRSSAVPTRSVVTEAQNTEYRRSWFERLLDM
jgi:hypothetical protein